MDIRQHIPFILIFIPLITGIIIPLLKKIKTPKIMTFISLGIIMFLSLILMDFLLKSKVYFLYNLGHYSAPWGNQLRIGILEGLLSLTFILTMILSILGGFKNILKDIKVEKQKYYFIMLNLLIASLLALVYTNDIFTAYVFIEINTVAACSIVLAKESGETIRATIKYFIMSALGSGLFLMGLAILYSLTGHLLMGNLYTSIQELALTGEYNIPLTVSFVLIIVSLGIKSALFPFYGWLPDAHSSATATSSAILSGLVLKGYIVLLLKIIYRVYGINIAKQLNILNILFILGFLSMIIGSIFALTQKDLKRIIAYSSVAQIGYIYISIGLGNSLGLIAAIYHIIIHALTKSMLFLASGKFIEITNNKDIEKLKGIGYIDPISGVAFLVGSLSMVGIPLFAGFISKILIGNASIQNNNFMLITMAGLAFSALLNGLYYIPIIFKIFNKKEKNIYEEYILGKDGLGNLALILLIVGNIFLGIFPLPIIKLIEIGI